MDRRTFMKLMGGLASMPIVGRIAKPFKSETVQEGIASVSEGGMKLYEMVIAKVMKEGKKVGESGRVDSYKHPDRPDITVDVNQTDGSAEIYFDTDRGSKGYAKIDRDMETGGSELTEAEEVYKSTPEGDYGYGYYKDIEEGIDGGLTNLEEFTRIKKAMGGRVGYQTGGQAYDPRASALDFATALDKVGAGTAAQKLSQFGDYAKSLAASGGKKVLQKLADVTGYTQHNINNQLLRNALDAGDITEKQYKLMGGYDVAQQFPGPKTSDLPMVGLSSLLYNAVKSGINIYDPQNPYAQYGQFSAPESIGLNMQGAAGLTATDKDIYERIISGKPVKSKTPLSESDFYSQFYGMPYKPYQDKYFQTVQKGDPNYDAIRAADTYGKFSNLVDSGAIKYYTGPTDYQSYLKTFADGGSVDLTIISMPDISGSGVESLFKTR